MKETITYSPEFQRLIDLLRRAADPSDTIAQFTLAKVFLKCKNRELWKKAFSTFKKLANQNYTTVQTDAQHMLGICYENGYGITKSYPRAIRWYKIVGHNIGNDLSPMYKTFEDKINKELEAALDDLGSKKITPEIVDCIIDAAESGDVDAQKYMMDLYKYGDGNIKADNEEAAYWAEKAAENGDVEAMAQLGRMYYYGQGVKRNLRKGLDLMEKAAEQGSASAAYTLGRHYERMTATKKAVEWFRKYAELEIRSRNKKLGWKKR